MLLLATVSVVTVDVDHHTAEGPRRTAQKACGVLRNAGDLLILHYEVVAPPPYMPL
jgi:hypothetical protein